MLAITSKLRYLASVAAMVVVLILSGCSSSSSSDLMERVPVSAQTVVVNDFTRLMDEAGYAATPHMMPKWIVAGTDAIGNVDEAAKALDMSRVVTFAISGGNFVSIVKVQSESDLADLAKNAGMTRADAGGYTVWKGSETQIAVKDGVAWIAPDAVAMANLAEVKRKNDGDYTKIEGVAQFLDKVETLRMAVCIEPADKNNIGQYLCVSVKGDAEAASANCCLMGTDGAKVKNDKLTTLQTDFLRHLPRNFNTVVAMGIAPGFNWDRIGEYVESMAGGQARGTFDAVFDILRQCDGTLAIAADGYSLPSGSPAGLALIHMPQEKVDSVLNDVISQFTSVGVPAKLRPDGQTEFVVPGMKLFVGKAGNYLTIGTQPIVANQDNSFSTTLQGQLAAASVKLETLRTYNLNLDYGLDLSAKVGETDTDIQIKFPGSKDRPLANILSLMAIFL